MSKNSKKPSPAKSRPEAKKEPESKKKSKSFKIIIAAVLALCAAAAAVLIIMHFSDKKTEDEKEGDPVPTAATQFAGNIGQKGEYNGYAMPEKFVEILTRAEEDSKAACKKYGEAMKIGGRSVSVPDYAFKFFRSEVDLFGEAVSSVQSNGANYTGFDPMKRAEDQQNIADKIMWNEKINNVIGEYYGRVYCLFDQALAAGYYPEEEMLSYFENEMMQIESAAQGQGMSADELMANTYSEGFTYAMFAAEEIISCYAEGYESSIKQELADSFSAEEIKAVYDADPMKYKLVNIKVYTVENIENSEEAKNLKTLDAFYEFAKKDKGIEGYDPEISTVCYCFDKQTLSEMFGVEIGNWAFAPERRQGDVGYAEGTLYPCALYMDKLPEETHSSTVMVYNIAVDGFATPEELHEFSESENKKLCEGGLTPDEFREYLDSLGEDSGEYEAFVNQFDYEADRWIHSADRKPGDTYIVKSEAGDQIICFVKDNPEKTYWNSAIRKNMAEEQKDSEISAAVKEYKVSENAGKIKSAQKIAGDKFAGFAENNKGALNIQ